MTKIGEIALAAQKAANPDRNLFKRVRVEAINSLLPWKRCIIVTEVEDVPTTFTEAMESILADANVKIVRNKRG